MKANVNMDNFNFVSLEQNYSKAIQLMLIVVCSSKRVDNLQKVFFLSSKYSHVNLCINVCFQIWFNFCMRHLHLRGNMDPARTSERRRHQP